MLSSSASSGEFCWHSRPQDNSRARPLPRNIFEYSSITFRTMWRRFSIALLLVTSTVTTCLGQDRSVSTEQPTTFCCGNWSVMCTGIRVRIVDSKTRQLLKGRKVQVIFSGTDGQWHGKPLTMTAYTGPGGILVFSLKKPIPPLMHIVDLAAYPGSRPEAFPTQEILQNGVIASWPPSGIQKADRWCTPDSHVTEPQKRPGEVVFFVHPLNAWQNFWYALLK